MGWRILQITKPCKLSVKNRQLLYEPFENDALTIPLEDVSVIILENKQILLSNALLSELPEYDVVLFTCDFSHLPSAVLFPFHTHSRYSQIAWLQQEISEPFKKRLWQEIVKAKINNQAAALEILNKPNAAKLREIAKLVQSGDAKNAEAFAAGVYWKSFFEKFNRNDDNDIRNSALNYGYAVLRGCMARSIVGAGLLPCFGIHHANKLNQFNLVDDMIEPFRPFVDYVVAKLSLSEASQLNAEIKNQILKVLGMNCRMGKEDINLLKSCEMAASSLVKAMDNKKISELKYRSWKKKCFCFKGVDKWPGKEKDICA